MKRERLKEAIKLFSLQEIEKLEESDRQYKALEELFKEVKDEELFFKLVLINALLSYQLQMKGEKYWESFASFFKEKKSLEAFPEFLSLFNRRFLGAKLKRFEKARRCVEELFKEHSVEKLARDLSLITDRLSECLSQNRSAKTINFAAKMFTYAYKIAKGRSVSTEALWKVDVPLDSRLKKLFPTVKEWRALCQEVEIPPIKIDGLIWTVMGGESEIPKEISKKAEILKKELGRS